MTQEQIIEELTAIHDIDFAFTHYSFPDLHYGQTYQDMVRRAEAGEMPTVLRHEYLVFRGWDGKPSDSSPANKGNEHGGGGTTASPSERIATLLSATPREFKAVARRIVQNG